jgi:hypothetical protein
LSENNQDYADVIETTWLRKDIDVFNRPVAQGITANKIQGFPITTETRLAFPLRRINAGT